MNEARCVVCDVLLTTDDSGAVVHVTEITRHEPPDSEPDALVEYERHLRNLVLCKEHWDKVERYLFAEN
jgi:autonomous glycyl radical cofactor GrcA